MKKTNLLRINLYSIVFLVLTFIACKRNDLKNENTIPGELGEYSLKFLPSSIDTDQKLSANINATLGKEQKVLSEQTVFVNDQEYQMSIIEDNTTVNDKSANGGKIAATYSDLNSTIKYRLVVFQLNEDNSIKEKIYDQALAANSLVNMGVYRNTKYKWIAYSYNNTTDPPSYPVNNTLNISPDIAGPIANPNGKEFIYDSGVLTTSNVLNGSTPIPIQFKRKMATLRVVINAQGEFLEMGQIRTRILWQNNNLKTGQFNLYDGAFTSSTNFSSNLVTEDGTTNTYFQNYTLNPNHPTNWAKYTDYYIPIVDGSPLELKYTTYLIQTLKPKWEMEIATTRILLDPRTYNYQSTGALFTFKSFTPQAGKRYIMKLDLVTTGYALNSTPNLIWARDNLYGVRYTDGTWEYRFDHANPAYMSLGYPKNKALGTIDVFNQALDLQYSISNINFARFMFTATEAGSGVPLNDVCKEVYPKNRWRLPTVAEYNTVFSESVLNQVYATTHYKNFPNVSASGGNNSGYQQPALLFTTHGYINNSNNSVDDFNGTTSFISTVGYYRTSDPSRFAKMTYNSGLSITTDSNIQRANIRCVRNL